MTKRVMAAVMGEMGTADFPFQELTESVNFLLIIYVPSSQMAGRFGYRRPRQKSVS